MKPRTFGERTRRFRSWTMKVTGDWSVLTPIALLNSSSCFLTSNSSTPCWTSFSYSSLTQAVGLQQPVGGMRDFRKLLIEVGASEATEKNMPL